MAASRSTLVTVPEEERAPLAELDGLLATGAGPLQVLLGERVVALPPAVTPLVRALAHALAQGEAVTVTAVPATLTIAQAADLFGLPRPYLVRLLNEGALRATREDGERRVRLDDLLAWRAQRAAARDAGLDWIVALSEELGLYDD
jgi:excisionase family DNA binding protein